MAATLNLDWQELLWLCEGAMGKSHLRWGIYDMMVNKVFPQLNEHERECVYTYLKRDTSWLWERKSALDDTPYEYWLQTLARFNPANQYLVTMKDEGGKEIKVDAYMWNNRYYTAWNRYCADEFIVDVKCKLYSKCSNDLCQSKQQCLRYINYKDGDNKFNNRERWACDKCDYIIPTTDFWKK